MADADYERGEFASLRRFLYFGDESKVYPASVHFSTDSEIVALVESYPYAEACTAIGEMMQVYRQGKYLDLETVIFTIAVFATAKDRLLKDKALKAAKVVCSSSAARMLSFTSYYKELSLPSKGWGRAYRTFLSDWYNNQDAEHLAAEVMKTKSKSVLKHRWTHKDVLCVAHVKAKNPGVASVLKYIMRGITIAEREFADNPDVEPIIKYLKAAHDLHHGTDPVAAARLIELYNLCLDHIPRKVLLSKEVALCVMQKMPLHDLLKEIPRFNRAGLFRLNSALYKALLERLTSDEAIQDRSLEPLQTFLAVRKWQVSNKIFNNKPANRQSTPLLEEALLKLHIASFSYISTTERRYLIAMDTNKAMNDRKCHECSCLTPSHVSDIALMALAKADIGGTTSLVFGTSDVEAVDIDPAMHLGDVIEKLREVQPGKAVLSSPINWALTKKLPYDTFIVFTDRFSSTQMDDLDNVMKEYQGTMHLPDTKFILSTPCDKVSSFPLKDSCYLNIVGFNEKLIKIIQDFTCFAF